MEQMITMSINLHIFMIVVTILVALYTLYATSNIKDDVIYINRIKYIQPQYLTLVTTVTFTGITVMAVNHFHFKPSLILMIMAVLVIFFTSIKKHVIRKNSNTNDPESMQKLRLFVKRKYMFDIGLILLIGGISFMLR